MTTYSYGLSSGSWHGDQTGITYGNDPQSTPAVTFTYDRRGRRATMSSSAHTITHVGNDALGSDKQIVVFFHGINNTESACQTTSETIMKRLYWAGYRGRVASVRWPCEYLPFNTPNPFNFNKSEFKAFKSASGGVKDYLTNLRTRFPGYEITLYGHSQGNIVATAAIVTGAPFDHYVLSQGAAPAHMYDIAAPQLQTMLDEELKPFRATPLLAADGGYHTFAAGFNSKLINFFNPNDYALRTGLVLWGFNWTLLAINWEANEQTKKPEWIPAVKQYRYDGQSCYYIAGNGSGVGGATFPVNDPDEIRAMIARTRTRAVGTSPGLGGDIAFSYDMQANIGLLDTRSDHSGQFERPIQQVYPYYQTLVDSIGL